MAPLDIFRRKGLLTGRVVVRGLPSLKMYSVSLAFFPVSNAASAPPFDGDPAADHYTDEAEVKEVEENREMPLSFRFEHPAGYYYLGVGVIAYFEREGRMFAQVERFFPMTRPCEIRSSAESQVTFALDWPKIPFEELGSHGVIKSR